jgi:protein-S-isoprenylcysteine O-methyltransferase Ste14
MWWAAFIGLNILLEVAFRRFVSLEHRNNYTQCRKGCDYYAAVIAYHQIWIVAAIQQLVAPSNVPLWQRLGGVGMFAAGNALVIWARRVNPFFVPILIYVPPHLRATAGPYAFCSHPGYLGFALAAHGAFFILGQWWAVFPMGIYQGLLLGRTIIETRFLASKIQL